jgi:hypothetical protein
MMRVVVVMLAAAAAAVAAGCASGTPEPAPVRPAVAAKASSPAATSAVIIGQSVQGRPIEMMRFGATDRPVLIMGAIHGDEPTSADVTRGLIAHFRQAAPSVTPVAIIPVANPDGYAAGTRTNSNRIDLNRNFPASNWSAKSASRARRNFGGAASGSEPETNALRYTIESLNPRLIISVHSMEKPCNNYDGPAQAVAELMSRYNGYPATPTIGYPTPGSLGTWAGVDRQIPIITLELPRRLPGEQAWANNRDAILAAIAAAR